MDSLFFHSNQALEKCLLQNSWNVVNQLYNSVTRELSFGSGSGITAVSGLMGYPLFDISKIGLVKFLAYKTVTKVSTQQIGSRFVIDFRIAAGSML